MENKEQLKNFLIEYLGERLICYYPTYKKDYSVEGRMYFPQTTVEKAGEQYYKTFNGLRKISDVLDLMKNFKSSEIIEKIEMKPVGKYMGFTKCRCCGKNLGNGSGNAIFVDGKEKIYGGLTGGADHYISHGINLNLVSHFFEDKKKKVKAHIIFVGEVKDIQKIHEYILSLENFVKPELDTSVTSSPKPKMR
jgi:hypothetical protein